MDLLRKGREKLKAISFSLKPPRSARSWSRSPAHPRDADAGPQISSHSSTQQDTPQLDIVRASTVSGSSLALQSESSQASQNIAASTTPHTPITQAPTSESPLNSAVRSGWNGFKQTLDILKEASGVFPPLRGAVGGLIKVIAVIEQVSENDQQFAAMSERLEALSDVIRKHGGPGATTKVLDRVEGIQRSIERSAKLIEKRMQAGLTGKVLNCSKDAEAIMATLRDMSYYINLFHVDTSLATEEQTGRLQKNVIYLYNDAILRKLHPAEKAGHDQGRHRGCLEGTRVDLLTGLVAWATDQQSEPVYWLNGMAGTGKSAIARSFCQILEATHPCVLGASFFCSRGSEDLNTLWRILPTIAFQLASRFEPYRLGIVEFLKGMSHSFYDTSALHEQIKMLFIQQAESLRQSTTSNIVIVIDALDECTAFSTSSGVTSSTLSDFIRVILRSPLPFKIFLTSRPETSIHRGFDPTEHGYIDDELSCDPIFLSQALDYGSLRLQDISVDVVEEDVVKYLSKEFSYISSRIRDSMWPTKDTIAKLAKLSEKFFIFAFTAIQYVSLGRTPTATKHRLRDVLTLPKELVKHSSTRTAIIDKLYEQIFATAYEGCEAWEIEELRVVLNTLLCLREPQSISVIAALINSNAQDVRAHLEVFSSVLEIPQVDEDPIFTFHASFPDYVMNHRRSGNYSLDVASYNPKVATMCLEHLNTMLSKNICRIERRQTPNSGVHESIINKHIPPVSRYACTFWASHLDVTRSAATRNADEISSLMTTFVDMHLLHWLEWLSLIQRLHVAVGCLQKAILFFRCNVIDRTVIIDMLDDARRLVPQIHKFVKDFALEVYYSAVAWLPQTVLWGKNYLADTGPHLRVSSNKSWPACEQQFHLDGNVTSVAFSPDGSHIVSGSDDKTVQIWNVATGESEQVLDGHSYSVNSVEFSPDGSRIVSGSDDKTVRIWNVATGESEKVLDGHSDWVRSVAFSPDGSHIVSGSVDITVRIWNVATGESEQVLEGHSHWVRSVAFSPDGSHIVSGSDDKTVRIWNAVTGESEKVLEGHSNWVRSVAFSPDGSRIVSGSDDKTVRIWNVATGESEKVLKRHTYPVNSVAFSPDGSRIVSGSVDNTIGIWNVATGKSEKVHEGHSDSVRSVAFSPDGSCIVSGSDDESVRIWNVATGESEEVLEGHSGEMTRPSGSGMWRLAIQRRYSRGIQIG